MEFACVYTLAHHGIKGQKWGVKNGPPYPLKQGDKSKAEKKAEKTSGNDPKELVKRYSNAPAKGVVSEIAISTAASLVYVAALKLVNDYKTRKEINNHLLTNNTNIQKKIDGSHTEEEDMAAVNPNFKTQRPEYLSNCVLCTTAYDLRRRGYDVQANTSTMGRDYKSILSYYKVDKKQDVKRTGKYQEMIDYLNSQPEGARGNICTGVGYYDSKHSMVWEKQNGKVVIIDGQSNTKYDTIESSIIRSKTMAGYWMLRTDDKEINWDTIRDAVVERKEN